MVWNPPATWTPNTVLTATQLNQQVRDNLKAIGDASTAFTPTWTGSGSNPAIGNGALNCGYKVAGNRLWISYRITMGTTTTYGSGTYTLGIPAGLTISTGRWMLNGNARDDSASGALYPVFGLASAGNSFVLRTLPTSAGGSMPGVTATVPFTLANLDEIFIAGEVELA